MSKYKAYFAIEKRLRAKGFRGDRSELVNQFTNGKETSLSKLSQSSYTQFLRWLSDFSENQMDQSKEAVAMDRMRKKVIAVFHKLGKKLPNGKIDITAVDAWCVSHGHAHKKLNAHSYTELQRLVTQAENMLNSFIQSL